MNAPCIYWKMVEVLTTGCSRRQTGACFEGTLCFYLQVDKHTEGQTQIASKIYWWETGWRDHSWLTWLFNRFSWFTRSSSGRRFVRRSYMHLPENGSWRAEIRCREFHRWHVGCWFLWFINFVSQQFKLRQWNVTAVGLGRPTWQTAQHWWVRGLTLMCCSGTRLGTLRHD